MFFGLTIIFKILLVITKLFEKLLNATIILGIPSKLLGALLGIVQYYVYIFILLYILSLPMFNISYIKDSKFSSDILEKTPFLNKICDETKDIVDEVLKSKEEYETTSDVSKYNQKTLNNMIDKKIITKENAKKLIEKGKIKGVTIE